MATKTEALIDPQAWQAIGLTLQLAGLTTVLLLVRDGDKRVQFEGERTPEGLTAFLAANGFPLLPDAAAAAAQQQKEGFFAGTERRVSSTPTYVKNANKQVKGAKPNPRITSAMKRGAGGVSGAGRISG